jgi:hypothetical protein
MPSPEIVPRGSLCNACIVWGRNKGDVEFFVGCLGTNAVRMDEFEGVLGCVPAYDSSEVEHRDRIETKHLPLLLSTIERIGIL